jgi:hypothetical protein
MAERLEVGDRRLPQFRIQNGCALTYMNASSGRNLSGDCEASKNANQVVAESCGALRNCQRHALFVRTNETSAKGVSDPLRLNHRAKKGGWQRGSLTPQMPISLLRTAASTETRAAQSAARFTAAKWFRQKDINTWT